MQVAGQSLYPVDLNKKHLEKRVLLDKKEIFT